MISDKLLNSLCCVLSNDKHILEEPITITCGHCACKKCVMKKRNSIKCLICDTIELNPEGMNQLNQCKPLIDILDSYMEDLFDYVLKQINVSLPILKDELINLNHRIDAQAEFMKEEIEIRIESIKSKLDDFFGEFKIELERETQLLKNQILEFDFAQFELEINNMIEEFEKHQSLTKESLYNHQEKLKELTKMIEAVKTFQFKLHFIENMEPIEKSLIGRIDTTSNSLLNRLKSLKPKITETDYKPYRFCALPNDQFASVDYNGNRILVYDKDFHILNSITHKHPLAIETNDIDRIYITSHHSIRCLDLDFNLINQFGTGGNGTEHFNQAMDLCYYNDHVYICDYYNKRIQKLTSNLVYCNEYSLPIQPCSIRISNNLACVRSDMDKKLYFYDVTKNFEFKIDYIDHEGPICLYDSCFYEFSQKLNKFYCFDKNGQIINEIEFNEQLIQDANGFDGVNNFCFIVLNNRRVVIGAGDRIIFI